MARADAENIISMARDTIGTDMVAGLDRRANRISKDLRLHPTGRNVAGRAVTFHDATARICLAASLLFHLDLDKPDLERALVYHVMGNAGIASVWNASDKPGVAG